MLLIISSSETRKSVATLCGWAPSDATLCEVFDSTSGRFTLAPACTSMCELGGAFLVKPRPCHVSPARDSDTTTPHAWPRPPSHPPPPVHPRSKRNTKEAQKKEAYEVVLSVWRGGGSHRACAGPAGEERRHRAPEAREVGGGEAGPNATAAQARPRLPATAQPTAANSLLFESRDSCLFNFSAFCPSPSVPGHWAAPLFPDACNAVCAPPRTSNATLRSAPRHVCKRHSPPPCDARSRVAEAGAHTKPEPTTNPPDVHCIVKCLFLQS